MKEEKNAYKVEDIGDIAESQTFNQLGILVLDGSDSMSAIKDGNRSLGQNVNTAVKEFMGYFKNNSSIKENISIAVVTFDNNPKVHTPNTRLVDADDFGNYNPLDGHGGGTDIGKALEEAYKIAKAHLEAPEAQNIEHSVTIIVLSDGICNNPQNTLQVAQKIKSEFSDEKKLRICTTYFDNPEWTSNPQDAKDLLLSIASSENFFRTTYNPEDLRKFFISSMSAATKYGK